MSSNTVEPSSWAELVRNVDQSRKTLPWDPSATQPVQRVSQYHVSTSHYPLSFFSSPVNACLIQSILVHLVDRESVKNVNLIQ